jgi:hypothetical protein
MKKLLKILGFTVVGLLLIQLIKIDKTNPPIDEKITFEKVENSPIKIVTLMKNACYDCHSNQTVYPDYASIAPISWVIKNHVNEARSIANFSNWGNYNPDLQRSILKNAIASLEDKSMPNQSYIQYHPKANITTAERTLMKEYFQKVLDSGSHKSK